MPKASKARKSRFTGKKKKLIAAVGVVILLAAALGVGLLVRTMQNGGKTNDPNSTGVSDRDSFPSSITSAQDLMVTGKSEEADKQLTKDIAATSNNDEKYELYLTQGVNYENQKEYDNAITAYKNAEAIKKTSTIYESLARVTAEKGDKSGAINYYNQALPLLDKNSPRYEAEKFEIEQSIKELGG